MDHLRSCVAVCAYARTRARVCVCVYWHSLQPLFSASLEQKHMVWYHGTAFCIRLDGLTIQPRFCTISFLNPITDVDKKKIYIYINTWEWKNPRVFFLSVFFFFAARTDDEPTEAFM